jgi:hypothetical protein
MMARRAFIGTLTGGLLSAPLAAEAQPAADGFQKLAAELVGPKWTLLSREG